MSTQIDPSETSAERDAKRSEAMTRREAFIEWGRLLADQNEMEKKAMRVLRHPDTTKDQLIKLHYMISTAQVQMEELRQKLAERFGHWS